MKNLFTNLPFATLLYAATYWPEVQPLQYLADAVAWFICALGLIVVAWCILAPAEKLEEWSIKTYPGKYDHASAAITAIILGVGMAVSGSPVLAAIYAVFVIVVIAFSKSTSEN